MRGMGVVAGVVVLGLSATTAEAKMEGKFRDSFVRGARNSCLTKQKSDAVNAQITRNFQVNPSLGGLLRVNYFDNNQTLLTPLSTNAQRTWNVAGSMTGKLPGGSALTGTTCAREMLKPIGTPGDTTCGAGHLDLIDGSGPFLEADTTPNQCADIAK